jgi:hypothetical protein
MTVCPIEDAAWWLGLFEAFVASDDAEALLAFLPVGRRPGEVCTELEAIRARLLAAVGLEP